MGHTSLAREMVEGTIDNIFEKTFNQHFASLIRSKFSLNEDRYCCCSFYETIIYFDSYRKTQVTLFIYIYLFTTFTHTHTYRLNRREQQARHEKKDNTRSYLLKKNNVLNGKLLWFFAGKK